MTTTPNVTDPYGAMVWHVRPDGDPAPLILTFPPGHDPGPGWVLRSGGAETDGVTGTVSTPTGTVPSVTFSPSRSFADVALGARKAGIWIDGRLAVGASVVAQQPDNVHPGPVTVTLGAPTTVAVSVTAGGPQGPPGPPGNVIERTWTPASCLGYSGGATATMSNPGGGLNSRAWAADFADGADRFLIGPLGLIPLGWTHARVILALCYRGEDPGNARLNVYASTYPDNAESFGAGLVPCPADTAYFEHVAGTIPVNAGEIARIAIQRSGGHADDTLDGSLYMHGVILERAEGVGP